MKPAGASSWHRRTIEHPQAARAATGAALGSRGKLRTNAIVGSVSSASPLSGGHSGQPSPATPACGFANSRAGCAASASSNAGHNSCSSNAAIIGRPIARSGSGGTRACTSPRFRRPRLARCDRAALGRTLSNPVHRRCRPETATRASSGLAAARQSHGRLRSHRLPRFGVAHRRPTTTPLRRGGAAQGDAARTASSGERAVPFAGNGRTNHVPRSERSADSQRLATTGRVPDAPHASLRHSPRRAPYRFRTRWARLQLDQC